MKNKQLYHNRKAAAFCIMLSAFYTMLVFFTGCASVQDYMKTSDINDGQLTLFLKGHDKTFQDISFELAAVNIIAEDGTSREIMSRPLNINSLDVSGRQILLGERYLPEGRYKKIQLIIKQASLKNKDRTARLAVKSEEREIGIEIIVKRNQNSSLFIDWNADASVVNGYLFEPLFTVKGQISELSALLVYVTNEESNNVSVIDRQSGEIVATVMTGRRPRGIATSQGKEHPKVYVANSGSNSVSVIEPTTNKVEIEVPVRFGREPEGIAVIRISPEKELLFVTNYGSDNVSVIDASSYQEIEKINVGDGPIAVAIDPPVENLSGTRFLSFEDTNLLRSFRESFFNVYVANKNSRDVSVIKMDRFGNRSEDVTNIKVDWSPIALTADYQRGKVYVANYNSENLSVIDILQLVKGNKTGAASSITNVGTSITGIITDPDLDRIYLLKEFSGEIVIIRPFAEAFGSAKVTMAFSPVIDSITVGISPRSFLMDPENRKIYTVNRGSDTVTVVDKTTKREEMNIPVGKKPYGIAMFPLFKRTE